MSKERYFSNVDEAYTYEGFCREYLDKNQTSDVEVENDCIINMVSGKVGILKISLIGDPDLIEDINEKWDIYWDTHGEAILKESEEYSKILEELRKDNPPRERKYITFSRIFSNIFEAEIFKQWCKTHPLIQVDIEGIIFDKNGDFIGVKLILKGDEIEIESLNKGWENSLLMKKYNEDSLKILWDNHKDGLIMEVIQ